MRRFRVFLLLLLSLAIPVHGYAVLDVQRAPCPMRAGMMVAPTAAPMSMAGSATPAAQERRDCCNDPDTVSKTGKLCKAGQECKTGGLAPALLHSAPLLDLACVAIETLPSQPFPQRRRVSIWRPPSLL